MNELLSLDVSLDQGVLENKDKSADNNANIDQSVGSCHKVVEEVEEVACHQTVHIRGCGQKPRPDDDHAVEDAEDGVHQHEQVQGTFVPLLQDDGDQVAIDQVDQNRGCP